MNAAAELVAPVVLDDVTLAAAAADAERQGKCALDVLQEMTGLDSTGTAAAVASAFHYRCLSGAELMRLEPAFDLLPSAEGLRRGCVLVRDGKQVTAVMADPFDAALRPWLEVRVSCVLTWVMAARPDIAAFMAAREQSTRAIDSAVESA